jgi:3-oxoacyl-[acyl-carrier protein] reductase
MIKNKNVLITGSSRGIGKAIAKKFLLKKNYNVIINANKSVVELEKTLEEFKKINKNIIAIKADVGNYYECERLFKNINNIFGSVDILINNAGVSHFDLFQDIKIDKIKKIINTNLFGVIYCSQLALNNMTKRKSGCIVNISSVFGLCGASCESIYSCSKGAVNILTKSLAKEFAPCNIKINAIACGIINTNMNKNLSIKEKKEIKKEIPSQEFGSAKDIAELAFFLSTNKIKYLTGEIIVCDGSWQNIY